MTPAGNLSKLSKERFVKMTVDIKTYVVGLLESYQKRSKQIDLLHYELSHQTDISENEMINALALSHGEGGSGTIGHISDKTLYIALNYQEQVQKASSASKSEVATQLMELENLQKRLTYYVSLLDKRQAELLELLYFEGYSQEECAAKLGIATRTVRRIKDEALNAQEELYCFAEGVASRNLS